MGLECITQPSSPLCEPVSAESAGERPIPGSGMMRLGPWQMVWKTPVCEPRHAMRPQASELLSSFTRHQRPQMVHLNKEACRQELI